MRSLILFVSVIMFMGCDPDSNNVGKNHDWWFEIKVDGIPHRIEGSFNSCDNISDWDCFSGNNTTSVLLNNQTSISSSSYDKGESDYYSGENFGVGLYGQPNLSSGINYFRLYEGYGLIGIESYDNEGNTNGLSVLSGGFSLFPIDTNEYAIERNFPINITQYPTTLNLNNHNNGCYDIGDPIIGSGSSTIYVLDTIIQQSGLNIYRYSRPYNIEIDFKLYHYKH